MSTIKYVLTACKNRGIIRKKEAIEIKKIKFLVLILCAMIIFSGCDVSKTNISKIENAETTTSKNEDEILTEKPEPEKETIELLQKEELDVPVNSIQKHGKTLMLYGDVKENN